MKRRDFVIGWTGWSVRVVVAVGAPTMEISGPMEIHGRIVPLYRQALVEALTIPEES